MLASASLGEDATLLDLLVEAAQGAFERLVLTHSDFCQSRFTSPGLGSRDHAPGSRPAGSVAPLTAVPSKAGGVYRRPSGRSNHRWGKEQGRFKHQSPWQAPPSFVDWALLTAKECHVCASKSATTSIARASASDRRRQTQELARGTRLDWLTPPRSELEELVSGPNPAATYRVGGRARAADLSSFRSRERRFLPHQRLF